MRDARVKTACYVQRLLSPFPWIYRATSGSAGGAVYPGPRGRQAPPGSLPWVRGAARKGLHGLPTGYATLPRRGTMGVHATRGRGLRVME